MRIKDTASLATKFATRAGAAANDYKDGVAQAGADWEANTRAAEGNYEAGIQEAISQKRFGKGVGAAGAQKFVKRAADMGALRYGPGVQAAKDEWAKNTQPYLDHLKSLNLPAKGPRRSPQNMQRAAVVAQALGALKVNR